MAFIPKTWVDDQIVYASDMNRIEQGIADTVSVTPQTLSAAQKNQARNNIWAAPAGYGYGDELQLIGHDNMTEDDFVAELESVYSNMPNNTVKQVRIEDHPTLDGGLHFGQLWRSDGTYGALIVYSYFGFQPAPIIRVKYNSAWKPWEYVNPPMMIGEEYRTTERYQGKPVYVKAVDFGALPNTTKKHVNIDNQNYARAIRVSGLLNNGATIPGTDESQVNNEKPLQCYGYNNNVCIYAPYDASTKTAIVTVWYYKITD